MESPYPVTIALQAYFPHFSFLDRSKAFSGAEVTTPGRPPAPRADCLANHHRANRAMWRHCHAPCRRKCLTRVPPGSVGMTRRRREKLRKCDRCSCGMAKGCGPGRSLRRAGCCSSDFGPRVRGGSPRVASARPRQPVRHGRRCPLRGGKGCVIRRGETTCAETIVSCPAAVKSESSRLHTANPVVSLRRFAAATCFAPAATSLAAARARRLSVGRREGATAKRRPPRGRDG